MVIPEDDFLLPCPTKEQRAEIEKQIKQNECHCLDCNWRGTASEAIIHEAFNLHRIAGWTK